MVTFGASLLHTNTLELFSSQDTSQDMIIFVVVKKAKLQKLRRKLKRILRTYTTFIEYGRRYVYLSESASNVSQFIFR